MHKLFGHHKQILLPVITLALAGCMVGPDFVKLKPDAPADWSQPLEQGLQSAPNELVAWWRVFNDPVLNELIAVARRNNNTLEIAGLRAIAGENY